MSHGPDPGAPAAGTAAAGHAPPLTPPRARGGVVALPVLALLFNAFVWGVSWWPLRRFESIGLHPLWATVLVYTVSSAVLIAWRPWALGQVARTPTLWVIVLAAGTTNACFNWGVTVGEVVRVVLLFYLMPLWSLLLARLLLGEPLTRGAVLRVVLAIAGAALVLTGGAGAGEAAAAPRPLRWLGDLLGLLGGMAFALNNVMLRRSAALPTAARSLAMFLGGTLIAGLAGLAVPGSLEALARAAGAGAPWWLGALALGIVIIASNLTLQYGAGRLPARVTSLVMLSEVVFATVSSVWVGGERFGGQVALGAALVLSAAVLSTLEQRGSG